MLVLIGVSTILLVIVFLYVFRHALYHYFEKFPAQAVAIAALQASHQSIPVESGWQEFRGVIHSHSHLSHDCEVSFEHILTVLKETKRDFICLSDHCTEGRADFASQWRGMYEGKLFIAGFEMKEGFMPFGVAAGVILSNQTEASVLAQQIVTNGGLLFYAHPEEKRDWERPELSGMEIYNIHADFKDEKLSSFLPDVFLNLKRYPDQVMRLIFDRPAPNLQR